MKKLILSVITVLMACTGGVDPLDFTGLRLDIVAGDAQSDTVMKQLNPLTVRATNGMGQLLPGVTVNFVVVEQGCGSAFAPATQTNAAAESSNFWTLGTLAGLCTMEVRAIDDLGAAVTFGTFTAVAMPGPWVSRFPEGITYLRAQTIDLDALIPMIDQYENTVHWRIEVDEFAHVLSADETLPTSRILVADSVATSDDGGKGNETRTLLRAIYNGRVICRPTLEVSQGSATSYSLKVSIPSPGNGGCAGTL